jgi:hypothetical protein
MDNLEHFDDRVEVIAKVDIWLSLELTFSDVNQSLSWPVCEPINCAAINKRREHA